MPPGPLDPEIGERAWGSGSSNVAVQTLVTTAADDLPQMCARLDEAIAGLETLDIDGT